MIKWFVCLSIFVIAHIAHSQTLDQTYINTANPLLNGATCSDVTLNSAVADGSTAGKIIYLTKTDRAKAPCTWSLLANVTMTSNRQLAIPRGVTVALSPGVTLTACIEAGDYEIFSGSGAVAIPAGCTEHVKAAWFPKTSAGLEAADNAAVNSALPLVVSNGTWAINANMTLDAETIFYKGGILSVQSGITLTIRNPPDAGPFRIFNANRTTTGTVLFTQGTKVWGEWWGAVGDSITDNAAAINAALHASPNGMDVSLKGGTFIISSAIVPPDTALPSPTVAGSVYWTFQGAGLNQTIIKRSAGFIGPMVVLGNDAGSGVGPSSWYMRRMTFDGVDRTTGTTCIKIFRAARYEIHQLRVKNCDVGVKVTGGSYHSFIEFYADTNNYGMIVDNLGGWGNTTGRITNSYFQHNNIVSLTFDGSVGAPGPQVRQWVLERVNLEHDQVTTGTDIALKIRMAEAIHCEQCWFESTSRHVDIDGGEATNTNPARFITFTQTQFGDILPASTLTPSGMLSNGSASIDGTGNAMIASVLTGGEYQFNQFNRWALRAPLLGNATISGTSWFIETPDSSDFSSISAATSVGTWRIEEINKGGAFTARRFKQFGTLERAATGNGVVTAYTVNANQTARLDVRIMAVRSDNSENAAYHIVCLGENVGGTVSLVGSQVIMTPIESAGAAGWSVSCDASGGQIRVLGNAGSADEVDWIADMTVIDGP